MEIIIIIAAPHPTALPRNKQLISEEMKFRQGCLIVSIRAAPHPSVSSSTSAALASWLVSKISGHHQSSTSPVCLIQHQHCQVLQPHALRIVEVVDEAAGSGHHNLRTAAQHAGLHLDHVCVCLCVRVCKHVFVLMGAAL
eukprot:1162051-Pelagomonas_calceolata.AAC.20